MDKGRGHEFQIGLTMSGAISAGAYTAGVLDFLIEALDAWEDARNGPDADTVPGHRVGIKVMSGAWPARLPPPSPPSPLSTRSLTANERLPAPMSKTVSPIAATCRSSTKHGS